MTYAEAVYLIDNLGIFDRGRVVRAIRLLLTDPDADPGDYDRAARLMRDIRAASFKDEYGDQAEPTDLEDFLK